MPREKVYDISLFATKFPYMSNVIDLYIGLFVNERVEVYSFYFFVDYYISSCSIYIIQENLIDLSLKQL